MIEQNIVLESLLNLFPGLIDYLPLLSFLAPIIGGGEVGVIVVAFLFAHDVYNFLIVLIFSFLGMLVMDSIWFFIGTSNLFKKIKSWKRISKGYSKLENGI